VGGGIQNYDNFSNMALRNSIVWGNSSGISNTTSMPTIRFSLVQGSGGSSAWNPAVGSNGGGNRDADPRFVTPVPPAPSSGGHLRLRTGSPALDAGSNSVASPSLPSTDADGNPRIINGSVDMGAYERQVFFASPPPAAATYGSPYAHTFTVAGLSVSSPLTFTLAGSLPAGLSLSLSGVLSGTPTQVGSYPNLEITASDGADSVTRSFTLAVTPAALTVGGGSPSRTYGSANPPLAASASGFVNGDTASILTGALSTTATIASPVGTYPIGLGTLTAGSNYTLTFISATLTVTTAPLTITADDVSRPLGQPNPPLTAQISGFMLGDNATVFSSPLSLTTTATVSSPLGSYPITPSGAAAANYTISFVPATLTVTSARVFLPLVRQP
jgi:hypothetical protein